MKKRTKKLPHFKSDEEMERFLETTDLSDYMSAKTLRPVKFKFTARFAPKGTTSINQ
jgi:hypothetical protein